jgi:NTE family protein
VPAASPRVLVRGQVARRRWRRRRPRCAFVLGGGGNRGAVQVGALRVLLAAGVRPDLLVGASVGAINAVAIAGDPTPAGVERLAATWKAMRDDSIFPHHHYVEWRFIQHRESVFPSSALRRVIEDFLTYRLLEDAAVPVEVVASCLDSGRERWMSTGPAVDALLASAAIPGIFPPVEVDGEVLIDGGVLNDVPVSRAFERGADRVFALLTGPVEPPPVEIGRPLDALLAGFTVAVRGRFVREVEAVPAGRQLVVVGADIPDLEGYWDFSRTEELMAAGEQGGQAYPDAMATTS